MTHRFEVTGDAQFIMNALPCSDGVYINYDTDTLTFASASGEAIRNFKGRLAPLVTDIIADKYQRKYIEKLVESCSPGLTRRDRRDIAGKVWGESREESKPLLLKNLNEFLKAEDSLIIDGFVRFRMGEYKEYIEDRVEAAVDEFVTGREYAEFIALLRCFVEIQPAREERVNIIAEKTGGYRLCDKEHKDITARCLGEFLAVMDEAEMNYDDVLLSTLITLAPAEIVLHGRENMKNQELYTTVCEIFGQKLTLCDGCELCKC